MKKRLQLLLPLVAFCALPLTADDWSIGVGTGPFFFGEFVQRTMRLTNENPDQKQTATLSAATRAGLTVDVQRMFSERFGARVEGTFTRAPLAIKQGGDEDGVEVEAGKLNVATFTLPFVFRINPHGTFRFHVMAGPAYAVYDISGRTNASGIPVFEGTRSRWGGVAGAGVAWQWNEHFAIEGAVTDTMTSSPFERDDFPDVPGFSIEDPYNVYTTIGVRYTFQ